MRIGVKGVDLGIGDLLTNGEGCIGGKCPGRGRPCKDINFLFRFEL